MKLVTMLLCILLASCSYHETYPEKWPAITEPANNNYHNLSGAYEDTGDDGKSHCSLVSAILKITKTGTEPVDKIKVLQDECALVTISSWYKDSFLGSRSFSKEKGNLTCDKRGLNIKLPVEMVKEQIAGAHWDNLTFLKATDESLIVKYKSSGFGIVLIIPIAGTQSNWYRLRKIIE